MYQGITLRYILLVNKQTDNCVPRHYTEIYTASEQTDTTMYQGITLRYILLVNKQTDNYVPRHYTEKYTASEQTDRQLCTKALH